MKGARDRKPTGGGTRERVGQPLDNDTKKISASQLAEVLARADAANAEAAEAASPPAEPRRTISGTRPVIRPAIRPRPEADSISEPALIDIPVDHLAPVIERPVSVDNVVNATAQVAALPAVDANVGDVPSSEPPMLTHAGAADDVSVVVPVTAPRRGRLVASVLGVILLAIAGAFAFVYRR